MNTQNTQSKHTPGPWRYEEATKTIRAVPSNYWLASMDSWDGAVNNEANARLIAAAPDLLAALKNAANVLAALAIGDLKAIKPDSPALAQIRAAISRAEGQE